MRTVLVVRDRQPFWAAVEGLLARANARVISCTAGEIADAAAQPEVGLVILSDETDRASGAALGRARIVLLQEREAGVRIDETARPALARVGWPVAPETFLELTARMLRVAERRTFRALLRVLRPRVQETFMGQSEDFSLTGMALRAEQRLDRGEPLLISLHLPGGGGALRLLAEVTREAVDPADGSRYYGTRFLHLDQPTREALQGFVWGAQAATGRKPVQPPKARL